MRDYQRLQLVAYRNSQVIRKGYTRERAVEALMRVFDSVVPDRNLVSATTGADRPWPYRRPSPQPGRENALNVRIDEKPAERNPARTYKSSPGQARN